VWASGKLASYIFTPRVWFQTTHVARAWLCEATQSLGESSLASHLILFRSADHSVLAHRGRVCIIVWVGPLLRKRAINQSEFTAIVDARWKLVYDQRAHNKRPLAQWVWLWCYELWHHILMSSVNSLWNAESLLFWLWLGLCNPSDPK